MLQHIRNFAIISHIDHGKTTLTDRFIEITQTVSSRESRDRLLDSNPIERERGITIKLAPIRMLYRLPQKLKTTFNFEFCTLNLIDTPGHVDFSYEVSRSLAACEGALLLVDATQGIQAQTIANAYLALDHNLTIIPVINKIDLVSAQPEKTTTDLVNTFGFKKEEIIAISAKTGQGVEELLQAIIKRIPPPQGVPTGVPLRALVFNSHYHEHKGVIVAVRLVDGQLKQHDNLCLLASKTNFTAKEIGYFTPGFKPADKLTSGEVGYIATGLKNVALAKVGDTITQPQATSPASPAGRHKPQVKPLAGYKEPKPVVFMELYPVDGQDYHVLTDAIQKLKLNDAALSFEATSSPALGHGVRVGFLGLLHAEIVQERLEREFDLNLIATTPTVKHLITLTTEVAKEIHSASELPEPSQIKQIKEPYITLTIFTPQQYLGDVIKITQARRATLKSQDYFGARIRLIYTMPLSELISGYYDDLKSASAGFASLDYELSQFEPVEAIKLEILVNHQPIAPLSSIVVKSQAQARGRSIVEKLKQVLPRQQFEVPIQAAVGGSPRTGGAGKILARATLKAFRKDVTAKLYGGDQTRKDKLLKKQKKGKKRMKQFGRVEIPQEAFLAVLKK